MSGIVICHLKNLPQDRLRDNQYLGISERSPGTTVGIVANS